MLWFADALEAIKGGLGAGLSHVAVNFGEVIRTPMLIIYLLILLLLYGSLLRGKRIAPEVLDAMGVWAVLNLFGHFAKINMLMLTKAVDPRLLLGQVITYLMFFAVAWGWVFWRLDRAAGPADQQILSAPTFSSNATSFDYFYFSLVSILERKSSGFEGVGPLGKILVAIHSLMVLDLAAIALARFYQLVQIAI